MSDGIFSSRCFNMQGFETDEQHRPLKDGQIFFGADYILSENDKFILVVQQVRNGEEVKRIEIPAKTERSARIFINKLDHRYKDRKPYLITKERENQKIQERNQQRGI